LVGSIASPLFYQPDLILLKCAKNSDRYREVGVKRKKVSFSDSKSADASWKKALVAREPHLHRTAGHRLSAAR